MILVLFSLTVSTHCFSFHLTGLGEYTILLPDLRAIVPASSLDHLSIEITLLSTLLLSSFPFPPSLSLLQWALHRSSHSKLTYWSILARFCANRSLVSLTAMSNGLSTTKKGRLQLIHFLALKVKSLLFPDSDIAGAWAMVNNVENKIKDTFKKMSIDGKDTGLTRGYTMVCFSAFSLKADQIPKIGLLLVFFLLKSLLFLDFP